jgi:parallel beta-helix repeat protein
MCKRAELRKAFPAAVFILALLIPTVVPFVNFVSAQSPENITIKADGSINPSTAPIAKTGNVYKMTGNISASVTIQKSNIVFDGDGYTIQSPSRSWALKLAPPTPIEPALNNITVKNVKVIEDPSAPEWAWGILLDTTTNSVIANCTISNIRDSLGIWVQDRCTGNIIVGNNLTNIYHSAIAVWERNNTIIGNNITANGDAIWFSSASDNVVAGNNIANNHVGIHCWAGNPLPPDLKNLIYHNNFINNNLTFLNEAIFISDTGVLLYPAIVNVWNNGTTGNYWSDYNGTDANGDGVGDTPYFIDDHYNLEGANDTDHYPLMNPVNITSMASYAPSSSPSPEPSPFASEPTASPSPSPAVPEMTLLATIIVLAAVTCMAIFAAKRKSPPHLAIACSTKIAPYGVVRVE